MKYPYPSDRDIAAGRVTWLDLRMWLANGLKGTGPMSPGAWRDRREKNRRARLRRLARRLARRRSHGSRNNPLTFGD